MAKEKTLSYIDYEEQEQGQFDGRMLTQYFAKLLAKKGISWIPTVKDSALAKRMVKEYGQFPSESIVQHWVKYAKPEHVAKFNYMYTKRHEIKQDAIKDWRWE